MVRFPASKNQNFIFDILLQYRLALLLGLFRLLLDIVHGVHYEASFSADLPRAGLNILPSQMLVPKVKHFDSVEGLTYSCIGASEVLSLVDEPLEGVEVPLVL